MAYQWHSCGTLIKCTANHSGNWFLALRTYCRGVHFSADTKVNNSKFLFHLTQNHVIKTMNTSVWVAHWIVYFSKINTIDNTIFVTTIHFNHRDTQRFMHANVLNHLEYLLLETSKILKCWKLPFWFYWSMTEHAIHIKLKLPPGPRTRI